MDLASYLRLTTQPYQAFLGEVVYPSSLFIMETLRFRMEEQDESNLCWIAVATSVSDYYPGGRDWSQCELVGHIQYAENDDVIDLDYCCRFPKKSECNATGDTRTALETTGNFQAEEQNRIAFERVVREIDACRVVVARINRGGRAQHAVAIYGYATNNGRQYFDIADPWPGVGSSHVEVPWFSNSYGGFGWDWTRFTKPESA